MLHPKIHTMKKKISNQRNGLKASFLIPTLRMQNVLIGPKGSQNRKRERKGKRRKETEEEYI